MGKILLAAYLSIVPPLFSSSYSDIQSEVAVVKTKASSHRANALAKKLRRARMERRAERALAAAMATYPEPSPVQHSGAPLCDSSCIECESGWDPQIWSSTGKYWGLYQFDEQTWYAHGAPPGSFGNGSAALQHEVAARVTYDAWPNC